MIGKRLDPWRKHTVSGFNPVGARPGAPLSLESPDTNPPSRAFGNSLPCQPRTWANRYPDCPQSSGINIATRPNTVIPSHEVNSRNSTGRTAPPYRAAFPVIVQQEDLYKSWLDPHLDNQLPHPAAGFVPNLPKPIPPPSLPCPFRCVLKVRHASAIRDGWRSQRQRTSKT